MWGVFTRFIKDKRGMIIGFCIGAIAFIEMYVALFPSIQKEAENLNKMMEAFPKGFMEAFGMDSTKLMFGQLESYMSTEYFSFFWPILITILIISMANAICVGEIEKGTIELTLSQPASRAKILLSRYLAGSIFITIFMFISVYGIMGTAILHNIDFHPESYLTVGIVGTLCSLAIFSIATLFSVIFSEKGKSTITTTAILLLMYAANIVSTLKDSLENLKYFSFFHYFDVPSIFGNNKIPDGSILVFSGTIVIFLLLSLWIFQKRDIAV